MRVVPVLVPATHKTERFAAVLHMLLLPKTA